MWPDREAAGAMAVEANIWIVDDDASVRRGLSRLIRSLDCDCLSFASGEELLAQLERSRPDGVLIDLHLPGRSGLEVLDEIRRRGAGVAAVMMTGIEREGQREACLAAGALDLVVKPVGASVIHSLLARFGPDPEGQGDDPCNR